MMFFTRSAYLASCGQKSTPQAQENTQQAINNDSNTISNANSKFAAQQVTLCWVTAMQKLHQSDYTNNLLKSKVNFMCTPEFTNMPIALNVDIYTKTPIGDMKMGRTQYRDIVGIDGVRNFVQAEAPCSVGRTYYTKVYLVAIGNQTVNQLLRKGEDTLITSCTAKKA